MTDDLRAEIKKRIVESGKTQAAYAAEIGVDRQYLWRMLNEKIADAPESWIKLLEALGLELVVQKKGDE